MGLFDIFKKKPIEVAMGLPTVKPEKILYTNLDKAFFEVMKDVIGFNEKEIKEIHKIISSADFLKIGAWHEIVFQEYFSGRNWRWTEYEFWERQFSELGKFPHRWIRGESPELTPYDVFSKMKVAQLKEFLTANNVIIPEKSKKENLLNLVESIPNLDTFPNWKDEEEKRKKRQGYGLYVQMMLHINFKSTALYEIERIKRSGADFEWQILSQDDKDFIELALRLRKDAIPPFFPTDITRPKINIDFDKL